MKVFLVLALLTFAPSAAAEIVRIKSGEHADFSRLVVYSKNIKDWKQTGTASAVEIEFQGIEPQFDLEGVFSFIPKTRLRDISQVQNKLLLNLNCDCELKLSQLPNIGVVVDIYNAPPPPRAISPTNAKVQPEADPRFWFIPHNEMGIATEETGKKHEEENSRPRSLLEKPNSGGLRGLHEVSKNLTTQLDSPSRTRTSSRMQKENGSRADNREYSASNCPQSAFTFVQNWKDGTDFNDQLGKLHLNLTNETGKIDSRSLVDLARFYLSYAMIDEVMLLISNSDVDNLEIDTIKEMSAILGRRHSEFSNKFFERCSNASPIWALLQNSSDASIPKSSVKEIARSFTLLSDQIRDAISARVFYKLKASGHTVAAEIIESSVNRERTESHGKTIIETASRSELEAMILGRDEEIHLAMRALLNLNWIEKRGLSKEMRLVVESYVDQTDSRDSNDELKAGLAKDSILTRDLQEALTIVKGLKEFSEFPAIVNEISIATIEVESEIDFVEISISMFRSDLIRYITEQQRLAITKRMEGLGLGEMLNDPTMPGRESLEATPFSRAITVKSPDSYTPDQSPMGRAKSAIEESLLSRRKILASIPPPA